MRTSRGREALSILAALRRAIGEEDEKARYSARFGLLQRLARAWGFEVYNSHLSWPRDDEFWSAWREFPGWEGQRADRKFVLHSLARACREVPGDTAECGVLAGASSHLICRVMRGTGRSHHVFDSFEGLSAPSDIDRPTVESSFQWKGGDLAVPLDVVRANLGRFDFVQYHAGWIPQRFGDVADRRFSFVHVDVDLYQPTRDSLAFFYERLTPGGVLLCDDYGYETCPGARRAFDELAETWPERSVVHLTTGQGLVVKRTSGNDR